jgi:Protein of unknown function (DUF3037)
MTSRYSVIQYLPDPATDERINIGVLAFGDEEMHARFVRDWRRVTSFGGPEVGFLKGFARQVEASTAAQRGLLEGQEGLDQAALEAAAGEWLNSIQVTAPRASTLAPEPLVEDVARRFLRQTIAPAKRGRDRRAAAGAASRSLVAALRVEGSRKPERYLRRNEVVQGSLDAHEFDVALANGSPKLGVLAMSFELRSPNELSREVGANAWTIDDVTNALDLEIAVVALPPRSQSKTYDHAVNLFESLGADVVPEPEIDDWASDVAHEVYPELRGAAR